ncbi:toll-like receptor 6 [Cimex lectularius]|uniref:TIR domain-containing protein n=1 Tax=Cimex lectularius TaxID=79782 RepID=A0A8I6S9G7_CIMLE|nr:toll-like receptor 6 [Cimex lectularius]XP_014260333.1 toll-like receptor 6 [Cimex lectularius]
MRALFFTVVWLLGQNALADDNSTTGLRYDAPDDCQWWVREPDDEVSLSCTLRTINSELDTTNFSVIPTEHTIALRIRCDPMLMSRSTLDEKSFSHLVRLRELVLEYCKVTKLVPGALFGLENLRNFTLRTYNTDWSAFSLELSSNTFEDVKQLERLDLGMNNIWSFPENIFCPMANLISLNVSGNRLQDIRELGFREKTPPPQPLISSQDDEAGEIEPQKPPPSPCNMDIQILDASGNHFVMLPMNGFSSLRRLRELYLHDNEVTMVAERALTGLKQLVRFDLSNNKVVALPSELFRDTSESIKEIYLQNNSISLLSPGLFSNLNQLLDLDISRNQLTSAWINSGTFSGLIRLVLLNLSYNKITKLEPSLFHDLYTLQILNLEHNLIEAVPPDTFIPMNNLHTLVLSYNKITYLDAYSFNGLCVLSLLSLDNNVLEDMHHAAFRNCTGLRDLNLNGNKLKTVPIALRNMRLLRTVDLGENNIANLDKPGFVGMSNLYGLRLIGNQISNISKSTFADLPSLEILNLSRNKIAKIQSGAFESNSKLQAVRLDANLLSDINGLFSDIPSLLWLNISDNRLEKFDYAYLPQGLQWLDIHKNEITELGNRYNLGPELKIQTLDVSFNKLTKVTAASIPDSVELLFMNDNLITTVESQTFIKKTNLSRVDLYANQIEEMELNALHLTPVEETRPMPEFYIGGNPFQCDCTMEWLQRINNLDHLRQHPRVMDLDGIYCKLLYSRDRLYVPLVEADSSVFLCSYKTHCFALCTCCDFDACDCEMTCPQNCTCYHDQSWAANIVDCSASGYTQMPSSIPMDATEVYLDGNNFGELTSHSFIGRKNLKVLYANHSNIAAIYNHTFTGLRRLTVLHLEGNRIKQLLGSELASLINLRELYLQGNMIHYIDNRTFMSLTSLEVLRLEDNELYKFSVAVFSSNPYLVEIGLAGNQWSCDCKYMHEMSTWVRANYAKVIDFKHIACVIDNRTHMLGPTLKDFNSTWCSLYAGGSRGMVDRQVIQDYLPLLLLTFVAFILCIGMVCGLFAYRHELRVWIYSRCGLRMCYKTSGYEEDHDRLFDAYVSYCVKDEGFVTQVLAPKLESQFRLLLHYRDFNVSSYVADTILEAVESTKRTIVILSRNFLNSEWCRFEFKTALHEVLKDRRRRLIVVLVGDLTPSEVDGELRLYLKTSTCLQWGDSLFWQKLRFAMPDPTRGPRVRVYAPQDGQPKLVTNFLQPQPLWA